MQSILFICFVFDRLLQSIGFQMFCSKHLITCENTYLLDIFYIKSRFYETLTNFLTKPLFIDTLPNVRVIRCWLTLHLHMFVLDWCKFKCFEYPASFSCVSNSIDICTVAIKNIKNVRAALTNQVADKLHFNDK